MTRDEDSKRESQRIIGRVGAETEATMAQRARDHMAGKDADEKDWAELWGTRIGRWLGLLLLVYLVFWLISFIVSGGGA
jgi:hypothetical protein